jgi:hypothetical protein
MKVTFSRHVRAILAWRRQDGESLHASRSPRQLRSGFSWNKGDIDIARELTPTDVEGMEGNGDMKIQSDVGGQIFYLAFNQKNEMYKNAKFLDAMRWAIDYQGMVDTFLKGTEVVHQAFLPKGYLGALEDTPYQLDVEKAKSLLAESGVKDPVVDHSTCAMPQIEWTWRNRSRTRSVRLVSRSS